MWCGLGGEMNIRGKCGRFYPDLQGIPVRQKVVEDTGLEPVTSCVQGRRSPN